MANTVSRILSDETLNRIIQIESAGKPTAKAPTSSARGLGQFINGTWLATMKKHRSDLFNGPPYDDEFTLEGDAALQLELLARFTEDNASALGAGYTDGDLYLAHFLGIGTARKFLRSAPGASAEKLAGADAVKANRSILAGKTAGQVRAWAQRSMEGRWDKAGRPDWVKKYAKPAVRVVTLAPVAASEVVAAEPIAAAAPADDDANKVSAPTPPPADSAVQGDPELWNVQRRLKAMNYSPGGTDGKWGGMTAGAISGFMHDRNMTLGAPTSLEMFNDVREELKAEIGRAESASFVRPVSVERAKASDAKVAELAPEIRPVNQGYFAAKWTAITGFFATLWTTFQKQVADAWNFFFDHKDDLPSTDSGLLSTASEWLGKIPTSFWIALGTIGVTLLAVRLFKASKDITKSVQTGARQ